MGNARSASTGEESRQSLHSVAFACASESGSPIVTTIHPEVGRV